MQHSSIPSSDDVVKVIANFNSTLYLSNHGIYYRPKLKYSTDGNIWYTYEGELSIITNQTIYLKGDNPTGWSQNSLDYSSILIKGKVSLSGNIMGLLDNGTGTIASIPNSYCFYRLFQNSTGLVSISENFLSATNLTDRCYDGMLYNCTSLITALDLPATNLATRCYWCMFDCCKLLNSIKIGYTGDYDSDIFTLWVAHTHSSGTFYYNGSQDAEDFGFDDDWITQRF